MELPEQTWQERFDEIGNKTHYSEYTDERFCCGGDYCEGDHDGFIKSFIAQTLEEEKERLVGEIENMEKYQCPDLYSQPDNDELLLMSKIINLIKK